MRVCSVNNKRTENLGGFGSYCFAPGSGAKYWDESTYVCLFVCPLAYLENYTAELIMLSVYVDRSRGSVLD